MLCVSCLVFYGRQYTICSVHLATNNVLCKTVISNVLFCKVFIYFVTKHSKVYTWLMCQITAALNTIDKTVQLNSDNVQSTINMVVSLSVIFSKYTPLY